MARRVASVGCAVKTGSTTRPSSSAWSCDRSSAPRSAPQLEAGVEQARALRGARLAQVVATAADAVDLLDQVHHLEVGRERAHQLFRVSRRQPGEQRAQARFRRAVAFPGADRRHAHRLDALEQRLSSLLAQEIAHQRAEHADVVAQRVVLGRELDAAQLVLVHRHHHPAATT